MRTLALIVALAAAAACADDALTLSGDEVARVGALVRCVVRRDVPAELWNVGPATLTVRLVQGGSVAAAVELPLTRLAQLRAGVVAVLAVDEVADAHDRDAPAALVAELSYGNAHETARRAIDTPRRLARALDALDARVRAQAPRDALPALWLEQAAELATGPASLRDLQDLAGIETRIAAWLDGQRAPDAHDPLRALRDPADGWPQPYRVLATPTAPRAVALLLVEPARTPSKARWRSLPDAWTQAARDAGVAIVEAYPAGDGGWQGVALPRARQALAECGIDAPAVIVGVGRGAAGALRLAEDEPGRFRAVALVDAELPPSPAGDARWRALRRAGGLRPEHLAGTPIVLAGSAAGAASAALRAATRCETMTTRLDDPQPWRALADAAATAPPPPREFVVDRPGRYGDVEVLGLDRWGMPGALVWDEPRAALRTANVGAVRVARRDVRVDGARYRKPAAPDDAAKTLGHATGPLDAYRDAPFVVVVGTGESAAAAAGARAVQSAFLSAWVAHAQSAPAVVDDTAFDPDAWEGRNLVLIGNPRSNAACAKLEAEGWKPPLRWDARDLVVDGRTFARADGRAVAVCWPHPARDGRLVVLLDGALPPTAPEVAPLTGLGDLYVGAAGNEAAPAIDRLFSIDWK